MQKRWAAAVAVLLFMFALLVFRPQPAQADKLNQIPTGSMATVTGTPTGPIVTVRLDLEYPSVNLRAGPKTTYDQVGILLLGQKAVAKGRSPGGDWLLIEYAGAPGGTAWVYAPYVNITPGDLPVVSPPATPTPQYTVTIDPTLAAQFVITFAPTGLPTFTPPAPMVIPTYVDTGSSQARFGVPMGLVIIALGAIGLFLGLFSLTQGR
jgi:Bacterial SH3 domain